MARLLIAGSQSIAAGMDSEDEKFEQFEFDEELVGLPNIKSAGTSSLDFDGLLQQPLKLHEDLANGCGGQLWPAGMVLTKYMLQRQMQNIEGRSMCVLIGSTSF